jgi:hypothetical protein
MGAAAFFGNQQPKSLTPSQSSETSPRIFTEADLFPRDDQDLAGDEVKTDEVLAQLESLSVMPSSSATTTQGTLRVYEWRQSNIKQEVHFELPTDGRMLTIGSHPNNNIQVVAEGIAHFHATLSLNAHGLLVLNRIDDSSRNPQPAEVSMRLHHESIVLPRGTAWKLSLGAYVTILIAWIEYASFFLLLFTPSENVSMHKYDI